jgi:hypothetical protein
MDPLESMWVSDVARKKGVAPPPVRPAIARDPSLPCFPTPTEVALTEQLRELQEGGPERACALVSCAVLPKDASAMAQYPLPLGAIVSPLGVDKTAFVAVRDTCPLCLECGAAVTSFSAVNSACQWVCAFCDADNETDTRYGQMEPNWNEFPELHHAAVEWDEGPCDHLLSDGSDAFVFLVDQTMSRDDLAAVARSLSEAVKQMSGAPEAQIALLGYDNAVHVYRLDATEGALSSSLCFPSIRPLNDAERDVLSRPEMRAQFLVPAEAAAQSGAFQNAAETLGNVSLFRNNVGLVARERGLAQALQVACLLANPQQRPYSRARIVFVLGGPPNLYPESISHSRTVTSYWENASEKLSGTIHSLEAILVSPQQCQVESFFPALFQSISGAPIPVPFASKNACPDFERALTAALTQLLKPLCYAAVSFGVFAQRNLQVTHVMGPLVGVKEKKIQHLRASAGVGRNDCLAVLFDQKLGSGGATLLQVVCSYVDLRATRLVKRVVTIPFVHTKDSESFRQGISDVVTGALLAKRVVAGMNELRRDGKKTSQESVDQYTLAVDRTLTNAVKQYEEQVASKNLASLPFICYALRKSPVVVGGIDDQNFLLRSLVSRLNVSDTLGLLAPKLFRAERSGDAGGALRIVNVPPEEVALNPRHVLGMDAFSHLFLWSGERTTPQQDGDLRDFLVDHLLAIAADRSPQPVLYSFRQRDSGARFVTHQLIPSHVDRAEELEVVFPELAAMAPEERKQFMHSFGMSDDLSFRQYCRQIFADAKRFVDKK